MTRTKIDVRDDDREVLDELARAIGIGSRTEANSILIRKCARHLIKWFSTDPHTGNPCPATAPQAIAYGTSQDFEINPTSLDAPLDL